MAGRGARVNDFRLLPPLFFFLTEIPRGPGQSPGCRASGLGALGQFQPLLLGRRQRRLPLGQSFGRLGELGGGGLEQVRLRQEFVQLRDLGFQPGQFARPPPLGFPPLAKFVQ